MLYTDLSKLKETDISIPKGSNFYLLKDGRICIYNCDFLHIFNMSSFKIDLTLDQNTFPHQEENFLTWGELVCLTELKNGNLVLGFGRGWNFTNLIIDIKDNKNPKLITKLEIGNEDDACREVMKFDIGEKEYFIAGDVEPQIFNAESPYNEIAKLNDIDIDAMMQLENSNLLAYTSENKLNIIDLTDIEKKGKGKEVKKFEFDEGQRYFKLLQIKDQIIALDKNVAQFVNIKNYENNFILLNKDFYSTNRYNSMCKLFNNQLLLYSSQGGLLKIDTQKKQILQKIKLNNFEKVYEYDCLAYKDKYLLFAEKDKLYEINYNEKEEIKNYIETESNYTEKDWLKDQDDIVKKIIEEKNLKKKDENSYFTAGSAFYDIYRAYSLKKRFPEYNDNQIWSLSMKEYKLLKPENKKFFEDLVNKDKERLEEWKNKHGFK